MANNNFELKVEVVRFNEKDVIATSGAGNDMNTSYVYVTSYSEFSQFKDDGGDINGIKNFNDTNFFNVQTDTDYDATWYIHSVANQSEILEHRYAWYNSYDKTWGTDEKFARDYSNLPTGIDK